MAARDEDLIVAYQTSQDRDARDELLRRHEGRVRKFVLRMVLDADVVDDLTQEVFLRAIRGLASFRAQSQFSTWLYRIAMNTVNTYLERKKRSPVVATAELPERPTKLDCPAGAALRREQNGEITAALAELSPKLRAAIVLTAIEQLSVGEAARIEGCNTATMYWRVHQARKLLKRKLDCE